MRSLFILFSCLMVLFSSTTFAQSLSKLEALDKTVSSWQASFEQTVYLSSLGEEVTKSGFLYALKPSRFRIEYKTEPQKTYLYNGKSLWLHQHESQSVLFYKNPEQIISAEALGFLSNLHQLSQLFEETSDDSEHDFKFSKTSLKALKLKPRSAESSITFLVLGLTPEQVLTEAFLWTQNGNRTHYKFFDLKQNVTLDNALFEWVKNKDIELIES